MKSELSDSTKPVVLVVDDDAASGYLVSQIFGAEEFEVIVALNGKDGFRLAGEILPFAIVMDYQLPDMNACELLTRLRTESTTANIPVLLATAASEIADACRPIISSLARGILEKPIDPDDLIHHVRTLR